MTTADHRPTAQIKGTIAARAALIASDYTYDRLPVRPAEMAAGWALEAYLKGWTRVPGSDLDDAARSLVVADEALAEIRAHLDAGYATEDAHLDDLEA